MILQKEFYFVRHGQTDNNLLEGKGAYPGDVLLNKTGRGQAKRIEPIISSLPIQTVCSSPLIRAQETKDIITSKLQAAHHKIEDLGECSTEIWMEICKLGQHSPLPKDGLLKEFVDRVRNGTNQALSLPAPLLIVAHGGVHWAICSLMGIQDHDWSIGNCVPVHFQIHINGKWVAKKL